MKDAGFDWASVLTTDSGAVPSSTGNADSPSAAVPEPPCQWCLTEGAAQHPKSKPVICSDCLHLKLGLR